MDSYQNLPNDIVNFNRINPKKSPLKGWLGELINYSIVIPEFQRPIVWTAEKVERLLNSVFGGFYIGSFLVYKPQDITSFKFHPLKGTEKCEYTFKGKGKPKLFLLDGQQRSFSLLYGLCGLWKKEILLAENESGTRREPYIFFVGIKNLLNKNYDRIVRGIPYTRNWKNRKAYKEFLKENDGLIIPTSIFSPVYETSEIDKILNEKNIHRKYWGIIKKLKANIEEYPIALTILEFENDFAALERAFEVINTPGLPLSTFDLLVAKLLKDNFNLRSEIESIKTSFKPLIPNQVNNEEIYLKLEDKNFVEPLLLLTGKDHLLELDKEDFELYWDSLKNISKYTVHFLENYLGVWDINNWLPYKGLIPVLIAIFYFLEQEYTKKTERELKKVSTWYWSIVLQQKLRDASNISQKHKLFEDLKKWILQDKIPQVVKDFNIENLHLGARFTKTSALAKAILNLIYLNHPRDFIESHPPQKYGKEFIEIDHIFPKSIFKNPANILSNLTILHIDTNRTKKKEKPSEFFSKIKTQYSSKELELILRSHFINKKAFKALLKDDLKTFTLEREREIKRKIADLVSV